MKIIEMILKIVFLLLFIASIPFAVMGFAYEFMVQGFRDGRIISRRLEHLIVAVRTFRS